MSEIYSNPYEPNSEKYQIWNILIRNDFDGFLNQDWSVLANDFQEENFFGFDFGFSSNPIHWNLSFPTLKTYKTKWLQDSIAFSQKTFDCDPREQLYKAAKLEAFEFHSEQAVVHKIFDGLIALKNENAIVLSWRSIFFLINKESSWKIRGFCGYINFKNEGTSKDFF